MDSNSEHPIPNEVLMKKIAATGQTSFHHILYFNSLRTTGTCTNGIEAFIDIHANLMFLHGFMAGFQYVALETPGIDGSSLGKLEQSIFVLRVLGFGMSLMGTLVSLITIEFLKMSVAEKPGFQVEGALQYGHFFLMSDRLAILAVATLAVTVNLVVHTMNLGDGLSYAINGITLVLVLYCLGKFKTIILDRQSFETDRHYYAYLQDLKKNEGAVSVHS